MIAFLLSLAACIPVASIGVDLLRDTQDLPPLGHAYHRRRQQEVERLTAPLPEPRESLLPEDFYATWPQRQTPSDLPPREFLVVAADRVGRHRAPEPVEELTTTGEFRTLVAAGWTDEERASLSQEWWCESCLDDHTDCAGSCACPCTLVGVAHA